MDPGILVLPDQAPPETLMLAGDPDVAFAQLDEWITLTPEGRWMAWLHQELMSGGHSAPVQLRLEARELRHLLRRDGPSPKLLEAIALMQEREARQGDLACRADVATVMAALQCKNGLVAEAMQTLGQAAAWLEAAGAAHALQSLRLQEALVLLEAELHQEIIDRLLPLSDEALVGRPALRLSLQNTLGAAYANALRHAHALPWYESVVMQLAGRDGCTLSLRARLNLANTLVWIGDLAQAETQLASLDKERPQAGWPGSIEGYWHQNLALLAWRQGNAAQAMAHFDRAAEVAKTSGLNFLLTRAWQRKAECAQELGLLEEAVRARREQVAVLQQQLAALKKSHAQSLHVMERHARIVQQNDLLRVKGSSLEHELANRNAELGQALATLQAEVKVRRAAEAALLEAHETLERKVHERTQELQKALRTLHEQEKQAALHHLVVGVAHELNTPLGNALMGGSTAMDALKELLSGLRGSQISRASLQAQCARIEAGVGLALENLQRSADLVQAFKALDDAAEAEPALPIDLVKQCHEVLASFEASLRDVGAMLQVHLPPSAAVLGPDTVVARVLGQLVQNALVHGLQGWPGRRVLAIRLAEQGAQWVLEVSDTGRGMQAAQLSHAFDPLQGIRVGRQGRGLGLHSVHRLVTQVLGGTIQISGEPDKGVTVRLGLPKLAPL